MVDFDCCGVKYKFDYQFDNQHITSSATSTNPFSFQMPPFSPVINGNGQGTINFTINICSSGSMAFGNKKETIDDILDGIDIKDIFD